MNRIKTTGLSEKNEQLWYKKEFLEEEKQKKEGWHEKLLGRIRKKLIQESVEENKENDYLKSVEADVVMKFIKDEVEDYLLIILMLMMMTMLMMNRIRSLDSNKMCAT